VKKGSLEDMANSKSEQIGECYRRNLEVEDKQKEIEASSEYIAWV